VNPEENVFVYTIAYLVALCCRYDCRGALSDLKSVEALPFGQSRWEGLTSEEKKIEQLCDEERYKSLNDKSEEESIYQGE